MKKFKEFLKEYGPRWATPGTAGPTSVSRGYQGSPGRATEPDSYDSTEAWTHRKARLEKEVWGSNGFGGLVPAHVKDKQTAQAYGMVLVGKLHKAEQAAIPVRKLIVDARKVYAAQSGTVISNPKKRRAKDALNNLQTRLNDLDKEISDAEGRIRGLDLVRAKLATMDATK